MQINIVHSKPPACNSLVRGSKNLSSHHTHQATQKSSAFVCRARQPKASPRACSCKRDTSFNDRRSASAAAGCNGRRRAARRRRRRRRHRSAPPAAAACGGQMRGDGGVRWRQRQQRHGLLAGQQGRRHRRCGRRRVCSGGGRRSGSGGANAAWRTPRTKQKTRRSLPNLPLPLAL